MNEQKYYVKLRPEIMYYSSYDGFESTIYTDFWLDKSGIFVPSIDRDKITKSELAEIMDGVLYTQTDSLPFEWLYSFESLKENLGWEFNETIDKWEYSNPIIELVPVEEVEK